MNGFTNVIVFQLIVLFTNNFMDIFAFSPVWNIFPFGFLFFSFSQRQPILILLPILGINFDNAS